MPMPIPPSDIGSGMGASPQMGPAPSYGGTEALMSQPTGGQMSDPQTMLATVFRKVMDLMDATNLSFPGGEDKISEGINMIGLGLNEKIQRMGMVEPQGPPTTA